MVQQLDLSAFYFVPIEVATYLRLTRTQIIYRANKLKVGSNFGRHWLFSWDDVKAIQSQKMYKRTKPNTIKKKEIKEKGKRKERKTI